MHDLRVSLSRAMPTLVKQKHTVGVEFPGDETVQPHRSLSIDQRRVITIVTVCTFRMSILQ